jgi:hypothetical protein
VRNVATTRVTVDDATTFSLAAGEWRWAVWIFKANGDRAVAAKGDLLVQPTVNFVD